MVIQNLRDAGFRYTRRVVLQGIFSEYTARKPFVAART